MNADQGGSLQKQTMQLELKDYFSIGKDSTAFPLPVAKAVADFKKYNAIAVQKFLDPALLAVITKIADRSTYTDWTKDVGNIEVEKPRQASDLINLILKRRDLLGWLEQVAGCGPLREASGEIFQMRPSSDDHLKWHNDLLVKDIRLAMVVYLGTAPHEGGEFEMRNRKEMLLRYKHGVPGSALIFRIHPQLVHRVKPILSGGPRRVYSAWAFACDPDQPFAPFAGSEEGDQVAGTL